MEHDEHKQKMIFTAAGARLGLLAYVILVLIVATIFMVG